MSFITSSNARVIALKVAQDLIDLDALNAHPSLRDDKRPMLADTFSAHVRRSSRSFVNVPVEDVPGFVAFCLDVKNNLLAERAERYANRMCSYRRARYERYVEPIMNAHIAP